MMAHLGEGTINDLDKARFKEEKANDLKEQKSAQVSRFIISPDNYWKT